MPRTFFAELARDDGSPVMVEYSFAGDSETSYGPLHGAVGGDGAEVAIVCAWRKADDNIADAPNIQYTYAEAARWAEHLCATHIDEPDEDDYL